MKITRDASGDVLRVAGTLEISVAERFQEALRDFASTAPRLIIDLSEVETCDTAALQLLCSARKSAEHAEKPFNLIGLSAAILNASAALGLSLTELPAKTFVRGPEDLIQGQTGQARI